MRGDALGDAGFADGIANLAGHGVVVKVVAGDSSGARVGAERRGGKDVLPAPLARGVGPFPLQGLRQVDVARADGEVLEVFFAQPAEVLLEALFEGSGQGDDAVATALAIVDGDGALAEVEVLDAQAHGLHEPEPAAIHDLGDEFPWIFEAGEDRADFLAGHDDGRAALATGRGDVLKREFLDSEDIFREECHGVEGLLLGGRSDVALQGEEVQISGDGGWSRDAWRLAEFLLAEAGEAGVPVNVSFLGGHGHVLEADGAAEGVDDFSELIFRVPCLIWRGRP